MLGSDTTAEAARARPFADILSEIRRGSASDEAAIELAKVVAAVKETGKKGTVSVAITVAPFKGNPDIVNVSALVVSKPPKGDTAASIFYPDESGNLSRDDPRSPALFPANEASGAAR